VNVLTYVHLRNIVGSTGAGRVARHITENLAAMPEVQLNILADAGDYQRVIPKLDSPWNEFEYRFFKSRTSMQQAFWAVTDAQEAETYWPDADIVYCTAESYVPTRRKRLVVTVHDAAIFETGAHRPDWRLFKQRMKWRILYSLLARRADLLHTVSYYSAERLAHYFPAIRSRLRVVYNAAPERFFEPVSPEGEQYLERMKLNDTPYILVPGGLQFRKNAEAVLNSLKPLRSRLPGHLLVIAGHSERRYVERARELGPGIVLTGFVDDEALCSLYHGARVVWFPSRYEGFGVPILEAMACGTPVVASNCTAIPEIARNAAILIDPDDLDGHIEALNTVCHRSGIREHLIARGRVRAREFAWRKSAAALLQHFQTIS
jgi:glycosyltransferase involved in cell wall biosynthesis